MRDRTRKVTLPEIPPEHDPELRISPEVSATPDWERIFGRSAPLILEIGTGNGVFLAAEAARHLEENFVGIEQSKEFFLKCKRRIVALRVG
ncbi:hypothetical protein HY256_03850, partial [Candidatus Sumerlaeota bacterium]|nr:hypothetical protein [Candidatus Sumerlaeota bacterium]